MFWLLLLLLAAESVQGGNTGRVRMLTVQAANASDDVADAFVGLLVGLEASGAWAHVDLALFNSSIELAEHFQTLDPVEQAHVGAVLTPYVHTPAWRWSEQLERMTRFARENPRIPIFCPTWPFATDFAHLDNVVFLRDRSGDDFRIIAQHMYLRGVTRYTSILPHVFNVSAKFHEIACRAGIFLKDALVLDDVPAQGCGSVCADLDLLDLSDVQAVLIGGRSASVASIAARLQSRNKDLLIYTRFHDSMRDFATHLRNAGVVSANIYSPHSMNPVEDPLLLAPLPAAYRTVMARNPHLSGLPVTTISPDAYYCGLMVGKLLADSVTRDGSDVEPGPAIMTELFERKRVVALSPTIVLGPYTRQGDCGLVSTDIACPCKSGLRFNSIYNLNLTSSTWMMTMRTTFPTRCMLPLERGPRLNIALLARDTACTRDRVAAVRAVFGEYNSFRPGTAPALLLSVFNTTRITETATGIASASSISVLLSSGAIVPVVDRAIVAQALANVIRSTQPQQPQHDEGRGTPAPAMTVSLEELPVFSPNTAFVLPPSDNIVHVTTNQRARCVAHFIHWTKLLRERERYTTVLVLHEESALSLLCEPVATAFGFVLVPLDVRRELPQSLPVTGDGVCRQPYVLRAMQSALANGTAVVLVQMQDDEAAARCIDAVWRIGGPRVPVGMIFTVSFLTVVAELAAVNRTAEPGHLVSTEPFLSKNNKATSCYNEAMLGAKALVGIVTSDAELRNRATQWSMKRTSAPQCTPNIVFDEVSDLRKTFVDAVYRVGLFGVGGILVGPYLRCAQNASAACSACRDGGHAIYMQQANGSVVEPIESLLGTSALASLTNVAPALVYLGCEMTPDSLQYYVDRAQSSKTIAWRTIPAGPQPTVERLSLPKTSTLATTKTTLTTTTTATTTTATTARPTNATEAVSLTKTDAFLMTDSTLSPLALNAAIIIPMLIFVLCAGAVACAALLKLRSYVLLHSAEPAAAVEAGVALSAVRSSSGDLFDKSPQSKAAIAEEAATARDASESGDAGELAEAVRASLSGSVLVGGAPVLLKMASRVGVSSATTSARDNDDDDDDGNDIGGGDDDDDDDDSSSLSSGSDGAGDSGSRAAGTTLPRGMSALPASFPVRVSKRELDFGQAGAALEVGHVYEDSVLMTNTSSESVRWQMFLPQETTRWAMRSTQTSGELREGDSCVTTIEFMFKCTSVVTETVPIQVVGVGHFLLLVRHESAMSLMLDPDEIQLLDVNRPIGDGANATVYRGRWRGRDVAVKFIKDQHQALKDFYKFEHEMAVLSRLKHPCITRLIGAVVEPGKLSLIMEYLRHGSMRSVLRSRAPSVLLKAVIARDAARGLSFLHASGILHRDVKPENVLVASLSPDAEPVAKLVDFGAARLIKRDTRALDLTRAVGTPIYMAPEVLKHEPYSAEADVYSFGMTMFEMFSDEPPYHTFQHAWEVAQFVTAGLRLEVPPDTPPVFRQLIEWCWANDAWKRASLRTVLVKLGELIKTLSLAERAHSAPHVLESEDDDDYASHSAARPQITPLNAVASVDDSRHMMHISSANMSFAHAIKASLAASEAGGGGATERSVAFSADSLSALDSLHSLHVAGGGGGARAKRNLGRRTHHATPLRSEDGSVSRSVPRQARARVSPRLTQGHDGSGSTSSSSQQTARGDDESDISDATEVEDSSSSSAASSSSGVGRVESLSTSSD